MRKFSIAIAAVLAIGLSATSASATTILEIGDGDALFVGQIIPGAPSDPASDVDYINHLITLAAGTPVSNCGDSGTDPCYDLHDGQKYTRVESTYVGVLPTAVLTGAVQTDTSVNTSINVTGFTYIIAKYDADKPDAGAFVWYVGGQTWIDLPPTAGAHELSNYTLFNPTSVPDGGATLMLLGGALVALGALRRRFSA